MSAETYPAPAESLDFNCVGSNNHRLDTHMRFTYD
jgi:hypothetical protein